MNDDQLKQALGLYTEIVVQFGMGSGPELECRNKYIAEVPGFDEMARKVLMATVRLKQYLNQAWDAEHSRHRPLRCRSHRRKVAGKRLWRSGIYVLHRDPLKLAKRDVILESVAEEEDIKHGFWRGHRIRTEAEMAKADFPYPPEPE